MDKYIHLLTIHFVITIFVHLFIIFIPMYILGYSFVPQSYLMFTLDWTGLITFLGIPVLHDSIGGSGWDLISGGKRVGELHNL